jgi:hypothetical protein
MRRLVPSLARFLVLALPLSLQAQQDTLPAVDVGPRVLVSADMPHTHHAEPHLAVDPTDPNHLLGVVAVLPDSGRHHVDAFVSFDGGETWHRQILPGIGDTETLDPWAAFSADGLPVVTVLMDDHDKANPSGWSPAGIAVFRSRDGGRSWLGPSIVPYGLGASYDQQKVGADHSQGPYRGRLYIAAFHWGPRTRPGNLPTSSLGVLSTHNARTFRGPDEINANNVHKTSVQPVVLSDGTLVLLYREWGLVSDNYERTDLLWAVHSTDGGATYSPPFLVSAWTSPGFADAAVIAAGATSDRVVAAWLEDTGPVPARASAAEARRDARALRIAHSDVRGMEWSAPVDVAFAEAEVRLTSFRVAADGRGRVAMVWVETTEQGEGQCHEMRVRVSADGGETFSPASPLAEPACHELPGDGVMFTMGHETSPVLPRFGRGGDYFGLVGLPGGGFRVLWSAVEEGVLRLWFASIRVTE